MNNIDRDEFIRIFNEIDNYNYEEMNAVFEFENDFIKLWTWDCDEYYILEKETGILINWYKHLGRANYCNKKLTIKEYEEFAKRILKELKENCNE